MTDLTGSGRRRLHRVPAVAAACGVGLVALLRLLRWRRVVVRGDSMAPTLVPGDRLLLVRARRLRTGQIVAVRDPRVPARVLVKRIASVDGALGPVTVVGDNPSASTDSRSFGPVARRDVLGRAVYRYAPGPRAGRLRAGRRAG